MLLELLVLMVLVAVFGFSVDCKNLRGKPTLLANRLPSDRKRARQMTRLETAAPHDRPANTCLIIAWLALHRL
eukprot:5566737-Amphidinium_carterae.1